MNFYKLFMIINHSCNANTFFPATMKKNSESASVQAYQERRGDHTKLHQRTFSVRI